MTKLVLKLFVADRTPSSLAARVNVERIIARGDLAGQYELLVIDVLECPDLAEEARIVATPTLVKDYSSPQLRIIGDLSDAAQVIGHLALGPAETGNGRTGQ